METQTPNRLKKITAILLAVLFVVSLTAVATSAAPPCKEPTFDCIRGYHLSCVNGYWKCAGEPVCQGPRPLCLFGYHTICINGHWQCVPSWPQ